MPHRRPSCSLVLSLLLFGALGLIPLWASAAAAQVQPPGLLGGLLGTSLPVDVSTAPLGLHVNIPLGNGGIRTDLVLGPPVSPAPPVTLPSPPRPEPAIIAPPPVVTTVAPAPTTTTVTVPVTTIAPDAVVEQSIPTATEPVSGEAAPVTDVQLPVAAPPAPADTPVTTVAPEPPTRVIEIAVGPSPEDSIALGFIGLSVLAGGLVVLDSMALVGLGFLPGALRRRQKA